MLSSFKRLSVYSEITRILKQNVGEGTRYLLNEGPFLIVSQNTSLEISKRLDIILNTLSDTFSSLYSCGGNH